MMDHQPRDPTPSPMTDGSIRCGVDLVEIERVEAAINRWGERFLHRVWTQRELDYCRGRFPQLASRFAAKEAVSKTLGTGIRGVVWRDIEILPDRLGKPLLFLHGIAREQAAQLGLNSWSISLTHTHDLACAFVVASRE
jgi:holo-[acyl-carrier protein] synthase